MGEGQEWQLALQEVRDTLGFVFAARFFDAFYCIEDSHPERNRLMVRFSSALPSSEMERGVQIAKDVVRYRGLNILVAIDYGDWL